MLHIIKKIKICFQAKKKVRGIERHPDIYPFLLEYDEFCMFLLNIEVFNIMTPDFPYTSENTYADGERHKNVTQKCAGVELIKLTALFPYKIRIHVKNVCRFYSTFC
jgi:hypothetical protein